MSRLLSVPISINFHELHEAIETVFAWDRARSVRRRARYRFNVIEGTPLKVAQVGSLLGLRVDGGGGMPRSGPRSGQNVDSTKVTMPEIFSNSSFLDRFLTYGYDEGFSYAIEMIGRSDKDKNGWITCLGCQGLLAARAFSRKRCGVKAVLEFNLAITVVRVPGTSISGKYVLA